MSISSLDDVEFLTKVTDRFEGYLLRIAAHLTLDLLKAQRQFDATSGMLEIGIYEGKSLSLILREAVENNSTVLGIDTFQFFTEEHVRAKVREHFLNDDCFRIHHGRSSDLATAEVIQALKGPARFVSVDGSHMAPDVLHDLNLAAGAMTASGIVSADDFLNPMTLGVNEGIARFMIAGTGNLSQFCYCANKLFLSRPQFRDVYLSVAEAFIRRNTQYRESKTFVDFDAKWRGAVEPEFFGHKVLAIH